MIGFQLLLDRGPSQEWFASPEVCAEAGMAALGIYIFFVHTFTTQHAIFNRRIWADRNFLTAVVMIVFIGILMFAGMAVLPTMLQTLLGYPVLHAGFVQLPRGVGTLISMFLVGRLVGRVDSRLIVLAGIGLTALSYYIMSLFSLEMDERLVVYSGLVQGLGLGLIFVPLSTLAFRTIAPHLRTEAASLFTLTRNIGSSIGISLVGALQIVNTKTVQEQLVEHVTPENPVASGAVNFDSTQALAQLNAAIVRQATMVAYIDSFHMLFLMCLAIAPLILFMNVKSKSPAHA
jgi:DHA2 family multidrug resistance protein